MKKMLPKQFINLLMVYLSVLSAVAHDTENGAERIEKSMDGKYFGLV
jgi:hypothetical protein